MPTISAMITFLLLSVLTQAASAQQSHYAVVVSSASGSEEFREPFWEWSSGMIKILRNELGFNPANTFFLYEDPAKDSALVTAKSTKTELIRIFDKLQSIVESEDLLFVLLLGHGSFDGKNYKYNLVGRDLTDAELDSMLGRFKNQIVVVCATPASGILTRTLSAKNRVIVTATKNEFENNQTIFGRFFVEAFKGNSADADKNAQVSLLEAYNYTASKVEGWYKEQKRLATEHPLLEDNGDQTGVTAPSPSNGEGLFASRITLAQPSSTAGLSATKAAQSPEWVALNREKSRLEAAIQELKYKKDSLAEDQYQKSLEGLLVRLAQTNQKMKQLER